MAPGLDICLGEFLGQAWASRDLEKQLWEFIRGRLLGQSFLLAQTLRDGSSFLGSLPGVFSSLCQLVTAIACWVQPGFLCFPSLTRASIFPSYSLSSTAPFSNNREICKYHHNQYLLVPGPPWIPKIHGCLSPLYKTASYLIQLILFFILSCSICFIIYIDLIHGNFVWLGCTDVYLHHK